MVVLGLLGAGLLGGVDADGGTAVAAAGRAVAPAPVGTEVPTAPPVASGLTTDTAIRDTDWWAVLEALDTRRARALEAVDPAALPTYAAVDSPAWRADGELMASLADAGQHPVGLRSGVIAIESVGQCPDGRSVCLEVVDQRGAYALADAQGRNVGAVAQAEPSRWRIALVAAGQPSAAEPGWRLSEVVPVP